MRDIVQDFIKKLKRLPREDQEETMVMMECAIEVRRRYLQGELPK